ncbi:RICIN domain-containing protein, partial [Streptomyces sp. NPDC059873]
GRDLLEPREDCADDNRAQQFRIESLGPQAPTHFRIRPVITDQCLSLRGQDVKEGTEVVQGRCSGAADQDFLIELIPPPQAPAASLPNGRHDAAANKRSGVRPTA